MSDFRVEKLVASIQGRTGDHLVEIVRAPRGERFLRLSFVNQGEGWGSKVHVPSAQARAVAEAMVRAAAELGG